MAVGGSSGAAAGAGGMSGAGGGSGMSGSGGFGNPGGGTGGAAGECCPSSGSGGSSAGAGGMSGASGMGGVGGGAGGSDQDAGTDDASVDEPTAPTQECEASLEELSLEAFWVGGIIQQCEVEAPEDTLAYADHFSIAVTPHEAGAATQWPDRKDDGSQCGEDQGYYLDISRALSRLVLCPELCQALLAEDAAPATVELIYGCDPPE